LDQRTTIQAKLPVGAVADQVPEMLQSLLEERFGLKVHHDRKVLPIYALTVGKDGPKFHESAAGSNPLQCNGDLHKLCRQVTMEDLANILSLPHRAGMATEWAVDRIVLDMTASKENTTSRWTSGSTVTQRSIPRLLRSTRSD
jgi:uncharacterized protein (TIGR03435 family)